METVVLQQLHSNSITYELKTHQHDNIILPTMSTIRTTTFGMRLQQWAIMAFALLAILTSAHSVASTDEVVQSPPLPLNNARQLPSPPRRLATPAATNYPTITITTPSSDPYTFTGMPTTLKAGTYKFKYINNSDIEHNFKIRGAGGFRSTPICANCTKFITVTLKRYVNGVLAPNRQYVCEPHASFMKGTVKITAA